MTESVFVLDRYNNKNIEVTNVSIDISELKPGQKLIYDIPSEQERNRNKRLSIGSFIGHSVENCERTAVFDRMLVGSELDTFHKNHKEATSKFPLFKKMFKKEFSTSIPVVAKYHEFSRQYYFYFYEEDRFNFVQFIKSFRSALGSNFFLFQVGARDMVRLSPATDSLIGCNGRQLCCKSSRPLPSVEIESILCQQLEGRDIERLKGRCGKLKCSLLYEAELYISESKKYPEKGDYVEDSCGSCGYTHSINIMTGQLTAKTDDGDYINIDLNDVKKKKKSH